MTRAVEGRGGPVGAPTGPLPDRAGDDLSEYDERGAERMGGDEEMESVRDWRGLGALARRLPGATGDPEALERWFARQLERTTDRAFVPTHLRVHAPEDAPWALPPGATTDVSVYLVDVREMAPDTGAVTLARCDDLAEAVELVETRYAALGRDDLAVARNVTPADADTLAACDAAGTLFAVCAGGGRVGLIATLAGEIDWIVGELVMEEVIRCERSGRGHAAAAQRALAARYAREGRARPLIGTIDGINAASRRSAERAGRLAVSHYAFVPLP